MSTTLSRVKRLTRQIMSGKWYDDRVLASLPQDARVVAVVSEPEDVAELEQFHQRYPKVHLHVYNLGRTAVTGAALRVLPVADLPTLHGSMRRQANPTLFIDLVRVGKQKQQLLRQFLYYLKDNGIYISAHVSSEEHAFIKDVYYRRRRKGFDENAQAAIHKVGSRAEKDPEGETATDRLAAAMRYLRFGRDYALVRKQFTHLLKIRDSELTAEFARERGFDWITEHLRDRPGQLASKAVLHLNEARFERRFPTSFNLPQLRIREYDNVICLRREAIYRDGIFLPDTFRLTGQTYLRNVAIQDVDINFARPGNHPKPGKLAGMYYHLDTEFPNVYGHLVTDMVGRLWAWRELKAQYPTLKVLISDRADKHDLPVWVRSMLNAYGIADEDIELLHQPMRVEKLFAPTPQFVNYDNGYPHPGLLQVWADLRDGLTANGHATDLQTRIFISRVVDQNRLCRNRDEVEAYFIQHGFTVLRPELLPQSDQVALFSNATHIAGYGGSAMLNGIFSKGKPKKRLIINPWTHHAINEYLISSLYGDDITYLYQKPEVTKANETKVQGAFHSPYTFNFDSGRELLEAFVAD